MSFFTNYRSLDEFHLLVDSLEGVDMVTETAPPEEKKWSVFISVDIDNGRGMYPYWYTYAVNYTLKLHVDIQTFLITEGVSWKDIDKILHMAKLLMNGQNTTLKGLYAHCGSSYEAGSNVIQKVILELIGIKI